MCESFLSANIFVAFGETFIIFIEFFFGFNLKIISAGIENLNKNKMFEWAK